MMECHVDGCTKTAKTKADLCLEHAKEIGLKGFKRSPAKREEGYKNLVKFDANGYPHCEEHGAMNCVNKETSIWRCTVCGVGFSLGSVEAFDLWLKTHQRVGDMGWCAADGKKCDGREYCCHISEQIITRYRNSECNQWRRE